MYYTSYEDAVGGIEWYLDMGGKMDDVVLAPVDDFFDVLMFFIEVDGETIGEDNMSVTAEVAEQLNKYGVRYMEMI
jgi:hypothetical protein